MVQGTVDQEVPITKKKEVPPLRHLSTVLGHCQRSPGTVLDQTVLIQSWDRVWEQGLGTGSWDRVLGQWSWDSGLGTGDRVLGQGLGTVVLGQGLGTVVLGQGLGILTLG